MSAMSSPQATGHTEQQRLLQSAGRLLQAQLAWLTFNGWGGRQGKRFGGMECRRPGRPTQLPAHIPFRRGVRRVQCNLLLEAQGIDFSVPLHWPCLWKEDAPGSLWLLGLSVGLSSQREERGWYSSIPYLPVRGRNHTS
ncbi:hypothetical protein E8E14_007961 [Neopestalotiopsis sp. 37M]|nr:hypothetical protein E8E14_007961 [Neopestalotiopsis sp. 37M]